MVKLIISLKVFFLIFISFAFSLNSSAAYAGAFFEDCNVALDREDFKVLKEFLTYKEMKRVPPIPTECFRLNNFQFLMTVTSKSMWGEVGQGLYYYDGKLKKFEKVKGGGKQNIKVYKEFFGGNHKRYVLLSWATLWRGKYSKGFDVINLVPTKNNKSFVYYNLITVSEDPKRGLCGEWVSTNPNTGKDKHHKNIANGKTKSINNIIINNAGTQDVSVEFIGNEQNCETSKNTIYKQTYKLEDGLFRLVGK